MPLRLQSLSLGLAFMVTLAACAGPQYKSDVWDSYDTRHTLGPGMQVPDSYARQYDQYIDNDNYYVAPTCTIMDSPACGGD